MPVGERLRIQQETPTVPAVVADSAQILLSGTRLVSAAEMILVKIPVCRTTRSSSSTE